MRRPHHKRMTGSADRVVLDERQIFRAGLAAHVVGLRLELNLLSFGKAGQARALDCTDVNEHIVAAILRGDKSETLLAVKPLHCTDRHLSHLSNRRANARSRTMREVSNFSIVFGKGAWRRVNKRRASNRTGQSIAWSKPKPKDSIVVIGRRLAASGALDQQTDRQKAPDRSGAFACLVMSFRDARSYAQTRNLELLDSGFARFAHAPE